MYKIKVLGVTDYNLETQNYLKLSCNNKNNEELFSGLNHESLKALILDKENYCSTLKYLILLLKELSKSEEIGLLANSSYSFYLNGNFR